MTIELSENEVLLLCEALRVNEIHSKTSFVAWMARNIGRPDTDARYTRAVEFYRESAALRSRLGDNTVTSAETKKHK